MDIAKTMPIKKLKAWDIKTPEEEGIIQEVLSGKAIISKPVVKFNSKLIPDIKTPEEEAKWQSKIDEFNRNNSPIEAVTAEAEKDLDVIQKEIDNNLPNDLPVVDVPKIVPTVVHVKDGKIVQPFCDKCDSKGRVHKKDCPTKKSANTDLNSNPI